MADKQGNVRVVARIRPLAKYELEKGSMEVVTTMNPPPKTDELKPSDEPEMVQIRAPGTKKRWFELDAVFDKNSTQEEVYIRCGAKRSVTEDIFKGFNCTILAYGQTGAGKSFSMGTASHGKEIRDTDGIIPRCCYDLFQCIQEVCDGNAKVELSYLEIYNEELRDLLVDDKDIQPLKIRETLNGEVYVAGIQNRVVNSPQEIGELMEEASERRIVAATAMNAVSSRSHAMCVLRVHGVIEDKDGTHKFESKLTLVDLAGSERIKKTGAEGSRVKEGININKSLLVLGQVVGALSNRKKGRKPPYRDSKLTRLLQDSLGGNSRTIMVACVSPADFNIDESTNTLRYATSARNIKNTATRNLVQNISPEEAAKLKRENQLLKQQVEELQESLKSMTQDLETMTVPTVMIDDMDESTRSGGGLGTSSINQSINQEIIDDQSRRLEDQSRRIYSQTSRIEELEKEVERLKLNLRASKGDVRKSFAQSALEIPNLRLQIAQLEEQVLEKDELEQENEKLKEELEEALEEAENSQKAATRLSDLLEKLEEEKQNNEAELKLKYEHLKKEDAWLSFVTQVLKNNREQMKSLEGDFTSVLVQVSTLLTLEYGIISPSIVPNRWGWANMAKKDVDSEQGQKDLKEKISVFNDRMKKINSDIDVESDSLAEIHVSLKKDFRALQMEIDNSEFMKKSGSMALGRFMSRFPSRSRKGG